MDQVPFYAVEAEGPDGGAAYWLKTEDGLRIRVGVWPEGGANGTVLLYPGRTEYIEKYGRAAVDLKERGFATLTIDWRGQGLADRMLKDRATGHVGTFEDYQHDVRAALKLAREMGLPEPYYLMAHSMGGVIGLRSLYEHLPVKAAIFSAPMWGINAPGFRKPLALGIANIAEALGFAHKRVPGTKEITYVLANPFEGNSLTTDPDMYAYMVRHAKVDGDMMLGGPSLHWLREAMQECGDLAARPAPDTPCVTHLGTDETIVLASAIHERMSDWDTGTLTIVPTARHEVLMETPPIRTAFYDAASALFQSHR
ncbi:MAG: lysophospholipase [Halocynthiibacter sp.]|jgi:lysophospholipase